MRLASSTMADGATTRARVWTLWSCEKADHASLTWICDVEQLYTDASLVLNASTRVVAATGSGLIDLHAPRVVDHADGATTRARVWSCEKADHASLTWICDVEQLYTDAALMLNASTRVVAAAGSGLIDLHAPRVVDHADGTTTRAHARSCGKAVCASLTVTLIGCTQTQRSCYTQTHLGV
jgi:hypothetical protein